MLRWACLAIALTACAGSRPPAARLFPAGEGECPDPGGCGVPLAEEPRFVPADETHGPPDDPNLGPDVMREASCADVGEAAASIEVGNYAPEEDRAPLARTYGARCKTLRLDRSERQCVFEAADSATVWYCAPKFWPQEGRGLVEVAACPGIANEIRDRSDHEATWERQLAAVLRSCEEDRWTIEFGQCVRAVPDASSIAAYCQYTAPAPLFTRFEDRMAKVK